MLGFLQATMATGAFVSTETELLVILYRLAAAL
jgi:hypothetical protein